MATTVVSTGKNLPPPQSPFVDPKTGVLSEDGYKFLINLFNELAQAVPTLTVSATVAATGATQSTAAQLTSQTNTVTSQKNGGTGVILEALSAGQSQIVRNRSGVTISVYPSPGSQIETLGVNAASTLNNGSDATFFFDTATQIRT